MSATWKTVRVFISSTFRDMQAERDHLVRFVFPRLREELLARRIHLVDVDLRWGVTSDQDVSEVCREVVDECHPRFLCMLGGRYGWVPKDKPRSITADEIHYGVLDREISKRSFALFYFRDDIATAAMVETTPGEFSEPQGSDSQKALTELKEAITAAGLNPFTYPAQWNKLSRRLIGLAKFGEQVYDDLLRSMKDDPELRNRFTESAEKLDEFAEENAAMESFIAERTERFVLGSRKAVVDEVLTHAHGTGGNGYLCLIGEPGSGKSALLAHFSQVIQKPASSGEHPLHVISHFIGASAGSTDVRRTLRRLCHELISGTGITAEIPEDLEKLRLAFPEILKQATAQKRIVILLDAVNQFDSSSQSAGLWWLPEELPDKARVILSLAVNSQNVETLPTLPPSPGGEGRGEGERSNKINSRNEERSEACPILTDLRRRRNPPVEVKLDVLKAEDCDAIIQQFMTRYRKKLESDQKTELLKKTDAGTPLYLLAALEELRTLGTYEEITDRIAQLPDQTQSLFTWILKRLEEDDGFRDGSGRKIGAQLVPRFVSLMGVSRHGLNQRELAELLASGDPQGNVAALTQLLRPFLMRRGELLDFYHGQFREAVDKAFLPTEAERITANAKLAAYFVCCAKGTAVEWETDSVRGFSECIYQLIKAKHHEQAAGLLSNFPFLLHKLRVGLLEGVFEDYEIFRGTASANAALQLDIWSSFFCEKAHILRRGNDEWPSHKILLQLAIEHADDSPITLGVEQWLAQGRCDWLWLRRNQRLNYAQISPCLAVLEGHLNHIWGALALPDNRILSWSKDSTLRIWNSITGECLAVLSHASDIKGALLLPDDRILSWATDRTLRVWDSRSTACLAILEGHTEWVVGALILPNGHILSWSQDNTLRIWNYQSSQCLALLDGHTDHVTGALVLPNGHVLSWANGYKSKDHTLRIWDESSGACLNVLKGHSASILGALVLPDGRILSWAGHNVRSDDYTLRIWDADSGECLSVLAGHLSDVRGAIAFQDGHILSWSSDSTLRLWQAQSGKCLTVLEGHSSGVGGVLVHPNGKIISWSRSFKSGDHSLRVWDRWSGRCLAVLDGHSCGVFGAIVLPDKSILSWARELKLSDPTMRIWNIETGECVAVLEGLTGMVSDALVLQNQRILTWGETFESPDYTLRIWKRKWEKSYVIVESHLSGVLGTLMLPGDRMLSWSLEDLRIWDISSGKCLVILQGQKGLINNAIVVSNDKILSWSGGYLRDHTLRLWDSQSGTCLATLEGHANSIIGAIVLEDGRILSWEETRGVAVELALKGKRLPLALRVWNNHGDPLSTLSINEGLQQFPKFRSAYRDSLNRMNNATFETISYSGRFHLHNSNSEAGIVWHGDSACAARHLMSDGRAILTQANGQVCILKLYHGNRRVNLAEAEEILVSKKMKTK